MNKYANLIQIYGVIQELWTFELKDLDRQNEII